MDHMQNKITLEDCQIMFSVINGQNIWHPLPPDGSSILLDPRGIFVFPYHSVSVVFSFNCHTVAVCSSSCKKLHKIVSSLSLCSDANLTPLEGHKKYICHSSILGKCLGTLLSSCLLHSWGCWISAGLSSLSVEMLTSAEGSYVSYK